MTRFAATRGLVRYVYNAWCRRPSQSIRFTVIVCTYNVLVPWDSREFIVGMGYLKVGVVSGRVGLGYCAPTQYL